MVTANSRVSDHRGAPDGEGRAMVLLHGAGGNKDIWEGVLGRLSACGVPALSLDLPGHGTSKLPLPADVDGLAAAVADRLAQLKVAKVVAVGHSLGGAVALRLAAMKPVSVVGLGVVSSGARLPVSDAIREGLLDNFQSTVARISRAAFGKDAPSELVSALVAMMSSAGPALLHSDFKACAAYGMTEHELGAIACPVAVVCGEEDRLTPMALSEALAAAIKGASLTRLPSVGHMAMLESISGTAEALRGLWERSARG